MTAEASTPPQRYKGPQKRLASVDAIRAHQRSWLARTRARAQAGEPFAICNSDEFEEIFTVLGIPVVVINYWNAVIVREGKARDMAAVLSGRGYPADQRFALGLASTMAPDKAPWGGLPKPAIIVGACRDEMQLRVTELWAREAGCPCFPMDFNFDSSYSRRLPPAWWEHTRHDWERVVDPVRLDLRVQQAKNLIAFLEMTTGRAFSLARLRQVMEVRNRQMEYWTRANDLIAAARPTPVSLREQMAAYQATWQRGTSENLELVKAYYEEVKALVARAEGAYPRERRRVLMATTGADPEFHDWLRDTTGVVIATNNYSTIGPLYCVDIHDDDPLRALCAKHLFLFDKDPHWYVMQARAWGVDAVFGIERPSSYPSEYRTVIEAAGFPYLALPRDGDDPELRTMLRDFVEARLS